MISCLTNYIGLENVTDNPTSGRYINDLQGIETSQFELIRKEESYDAEAAWAKVEKRAIKKLESQINKWAQKYYARYSYVNNLVTSQVEGNDSISTASNYVGWFFRGFNSFYKNMSLELQWVELHSATDVTTSIRIYNASTGDLLDTVEATLSANTINRVILNKSYPFWKYPNLFIAYDESEVQTKKAVDLGYGYNISLSQQRIPKSSSIIETNLNEGVGTTGQGMVLCFNVNCSLDNYVCQRLSLFEEPYLYLLGVEFCNERIYSDRVSRYTLLDRERAIELKDELEAEYLTSLEAVLKNLTIDYPNDYCFECERELNPKILLP